MKRARDEFAGIQLPKDNNPKDIQRIPGVDYSTTIEQLPPKLVPAKPGDVICVVCGRPIVDSDLATDPKTRAYEIKFRLHHACNDAKDRVIDIQSNEEPDRHRKAAEEAAKKKAARALPPVSKENRIMKF